VRYFTLAWWCGTREDDGRDPVAEYARHLAATRDPVEVLDAVEGCRAVRRKLRGKRGRRLFKVLWDLHGIVGRPPRSAGGSGWPGSGSGSSNGKPWTWPAPDRPRATAARR
jgi:hypothetical protein